MLRLNSALKFTSQAAVATNYAPNIGLAKAEGLRIKRTLNLPSASKLAKGNLAQGVLLIDMENDFMPGGRLQVPGAFEDVSRMISLIMRMVEQGVLGRVMVTKDVHPLDSIHGVSWYRDKYGNVPYSDVPFSLVMGDPTSKFPLVGSINITGEFRPVYERDWTVNTYAPAVADMGGIWVWPWHCLEGTDGVNINPALFECLAFACSAMGIEIDWLYKGQIAKVDWFGAFRPVVKVPGHPQGDTQFTYLEIIRNLHRLYVGGEADDFCVKSTMQQVLEYFGDPNDRGVLEKIRFVADGTSAIFPDDPAAGRTPNADFHNEMAAKGVQIVNHDTTLD